MINQGINVPDKTIAIFTDPYKTLFHSTEKNRLNNIIEKSPKKRDWFTPHFYRCLPLLIGNQYGFIIKSEFDFSFVWDGREENDSIKFEFGINSENQFPVISSHFGSGIITINPPFILRTPPGVNLMTISPPNFIIPNVTVMTGVVETDHIRSNFTFNLKVQIPNIKVDVKAGTPLAAFIPIPRYYADSFELKHAEDIFSQEIIDEELQANLDAFTFRSGPEKELPNSVGRLYFRGEDIYKNKFPDHQSP
jgi:hypothetical protein